MNLTEGQWTYVILINIIAFILMGIDKAKARRGAWRISERTLIILAVIGGSLGMLFGIHMFRHKTKHAKFKLGIPFIIVLQILLFFLWKMVI